MKENPVARRTSRIRLTLYILAITGVCALGTFGVSSHLVKTRAQLRDWSPGVICQEVLRGDQLVLVDEGGATQRVQVLGIQAPPVERGAALEQMARELGLREDFLLKQGHIAMSVLQGWVSRRHVRVTLPEGFELQDPSGIQLGYASRQGVDLGRKMLQGGQARAVNIPHPRLAEYLAYEQEARAAKVGLWRDPR